jgi:dTDP-4-amino-4,6-dideoxygalactose transaminase
MIVPFINLRPGLESTRELWETRLAEMFTDMQFILGKQLRNFEKEFAEFLGCSYSVGVGSGSNALELCLRVMNVQGEVITSTLTSPFTALAILAAGAQPVFADVNEETLLIDMSTVSNQLSNRATAIIPVHLYGQVCNMEEITDIARSCNLLVLQDACQAHGARFRRIPLTHFSACVSYSFYPTKNLGCLGDGGAIATNDRRIQTKLRSIRDGARKDGRHVSYGPGINSRLDEIQACYLRAFLTRLSVWNQCRAVIATAYDSLLNDCPGIQLMKRTSDSVNHIYAIRAIKRNALRKYLADRGVETGIHYPVPLHLQPAFTATQRRKRLPVAEKACRQLLSLPIWPQMSQSQVNMVAEHVRSFYR